MTLYHDLTEAQIADCQKFDAQIWSDLYKDAHGHRPRFSLGHMTAAELDALWDRTCDALSAELDAESTREVEAELAFDARLNSLIALGAVDRNQAFRWLMDAEGVDRRDVEVYGWESACFTLGLPFRMKDELAALAR